ncbi:hypothetical protein [Nocardia sp. CA-120079]|uniref:hypothetical protein n=1 Tax=Nocardia sp. CA-120079 TaxID=3239974 RepID=UPI003D999690
MFATLPANMLIKTRHSIPPLGVDVFAAPLDGLVLAETEFTNDDDMLTFVPPDYVIAEITDDPRFTGGRLAITPRDQLRCWLADFGIDISSSQDTTAQTIDLPNR